MNNETSMNGLNAYRALAAAMYQAAGAYDMPVRFLDLLSAAANGEYFTVEQTFALLPCDTPGFLQRAEKAEDELWAYKDVMDELRDSPCKYPPWRDAREVVEWIERRVAVRLAANAGNQRSRSDPLD